MRKVEGVDDALNCVQYYFNLYARLYHMASLELVIVICIGACVCMLTCRSKISRSHFERVEGPVISFLVQR